VAISQHAILTDQHFTVITTNLTIADHAITTLSQFRLHASILEVYVILLLLREEERLP